MAYYADGYCNNKLLPRLDARDRARLVDVGRQPDSGHSGPGASLQTEIETKQGVQLGSNPSRYCGATKALKT